MLLGSAPLAPYPNVPAPDRSPNPTLFSIKKSMSFGSRSDQKTPRFWVLLGAQLGPLGRPNRPKFGPRGPKIDPRRAKMASRLAKITIFIQNSDFQKTLKFLRKINDFGSPSRPKIAPGWPQAGQDGPRSAQDGSKTIPRWS